MEKYKDLTREEVEAELIHAELIIENLTRVNGELNTSLISKEILLKQAQDKIQKQEQQFLDHVEKDTPKKK